MKVSKYFTRQELECPCCHQLATETGAISRDDFIIFLDKLDELREACGFALVGSSSYRCPIHNAAIGGAAKSRHLVGDAIDIAIRGEQAYTLLSNAFRLGWTGVGVNQKGEGRFIHLDLRNTKTVWSY